MAVLQMKVGPEPGRLFTLNSDRSMLGRHPDCDIYEVFLEVSAVSRHHAQILHENEKFFVEDLDSRNGTLLNDQRITNKIELDDGDRVRICDIEFLFYSGLPPVQTDDVAEDSSAFARTLMIDDTGEGLTNSTIMSKVEVSKQSGMQLAGNPANKLRALVELLGNLGPSLELDEILDNILTGLFQVFTQADRGFIGLKLPDDGPVVPRAVKHRHLGKDDTVRISRTIVNQVLESRRAILSADAANDSRFDMAQSIADFHIRSMMCAPLLDSGDQPLGVIQVDTLDQRNRFTHDDLEVLASIAPQAALALQYAQLHEIALNQRSLERDLEAAHQVQTGLLPAHRPTVPGYHFFDFYNPARQVGGDYYDYIALSGGRMAVVLADVSGKGMPAALLMANLSGELKYCLASEPSPCEAISRFNASFASGRAGDHFVTLVLVVIDPATHRATIVNAGHMPPLLRHNDALVEDVGSDVAGLPIGVLADFKYEQCEIPLQPGESLTAFTDGFSEAMNSGGQLYGVERLHDQVSRSVEDVAHLGQHIIDDVRVFVRETPQSDDMCLTCLGRDPA